MEVGVDGVRKLKANATNLRGVAQKIGQSLRSRTAICLSIRRQT
jgi:hypothetical protein